MWPNITVRRYTRSTPLLQTKRFLAANYGWAATFFTEQNKKKFITYSSSICRKFYKRVHWKYITAGHTFIALENLCAFWSPAMSKWPKPNTTNWTYFEDWCDQLAYANFRTQSNGNSTCIHTYVRKWTFILTFHVCCPIWVRLFKRNLHISLLSLYEFRKNRRWEGRTFLWP